MSAPTLRRSSTIRRGLIYGLTCGAIAVAVAHGGAQSRTPFAVPTPETPQPTKGMPAVPGSRAQGWQGQGRSEVIARHGMVATSDPLASQAGLDILEQGGNAVDAAVAAAAVLDVTSQNDTGIGGDLFAIVWVAREKKLYAINAAGRAPAGWLVTGEALSRDGAHAGTAIRRRRPRSRRGLTAPAPDRSRRPRW